MSSEGKGFGGTLRNFYTSSDQANRNSQQSYSGKNNNNNNNNNNNDDEDLSMFNQQDNKNNSGSGNSKDDGVFVYSDEENSGPKDIDLKTSKIKVQTTTIMKRKLDDNNSAQPNKRSNNGGDGGIDEFGNEDEYDLDIDFNQIEEEVASQQKLKQTSTTSSSSPVSVSDELANRWQWRSDEKWIDYDIEKMYQIEESFNKSNKQISIDSERYVEFKTFKQKRFDSNLKQRDVRRVPFKLPVSSLPNNLTGEQSKFKPTSTSNTSNNNNNNNNNNSNQNSKFNAAFSMFPSSSPKQTTSSSSSSTTPKQTTSNNNTPKNNNSNSSSSNNSNEPTKWQWRDDKGLWIDYKDEFSSKLEESQKKGSKRCQIDDDRFVDIENFLQRRYDDNNKVRPVRRIDGSNSGSGNKSGSIPMSVTKQTSSPTFKPSNSTSSSSSSVSSLKPISKPTTPTKPKQQTFNNDFEGGNDDYDNGESNNNNQESGKWYWQSDNGWQEYNSEINETIERGYNKKEKSLHIKIGNEMKIIDYLAFVQRRTDDTSKRRNIKREVVADFKPYQSKSNSNNNNSSSNNNYNNNKNISNNDKDSISVNNFKKNNNNNNEENQQQQQQLEFDDDSLFENNGSGSGETEEDLMADELDMSDPKFREKKRALYKCGSEYKTLDNLPTWYQFLETNRHRAKPPTNNKDIIPSAYMNKKICLYGGDITTLEVDAIVNAARPSLLGGGGIDGSIHKAAGIGLVRECKVFGKCKFGDAVLTRGYRLPAKYVIHTVGPMDKNAETLKKCYDSCLDIVLKNNLKTVVFCCIATGVYGFPSLDAAHIAIQTISDWLKIHHKKVDRVIFCIFKKEDYQIYGKLLQTYFPIHQIEN